MRGRLIASALVGMGCFFAKTQANVVAAPATRAATSRADMREVRATIAEVKGLVSVRESEDAPFRPATVGMTLAMGAEFRTGPRSGVLLTLPANQALRIDRLGLVKLLEAYQGDARFHTDVGMKYGRVRYEVEAGGLQHDSIIRSPSSALAVRGTVVELTDDAFGSRVRLVRGEADAKTGAGVVALKRSEDATGEGVTITDADASLAGSLYGDAATPYSDSDALGGGEGEVFAFNNSVNGNATGLMLDDLHDFAGGAGFLDFTGPVEPPPPPTGLGKLAFVLTWRGDGSSRQGAPDLDLVVLSPTGKFFETGKAVRIDGNVKVGRNDRGGRAPNREKIQWLAECPPGIYGYSVHYRAGGEPATFTVQVSLNAKRIDRPFRDTVSPKDREAAFTIAVPPGFQALAKGKGGGGGAGIVPPAKQPPSKRPVKPLVRPVVAPATPPRR